MSGKNIFGYFVGILLFLIIIPGVMYGVAVNFVVPIVFISYMVWHVKKFEEPRLYNDFKDEYLRYRNTTPLLFPKFKK